MQPRTLERSTVLAATPGQVWAAIGDFGGLADWHPHIQPSTIEDDADPAVPGAVRVFAVDGRIVARERLLDRDPDARWYSYALLPPVVLPVAEFVATLAVHPHADVAEVRWSAVYQGTDEVVPQVESLFGDGTYGAGLDALRTLFSQS
ncbi:SRPBCC family protein [Streptomyces sp. NBC_01197]|uniref:SRPBCC family protein n=1 Tax=Streptomyces sp. NBC_01197 TaxID=2903768 RepID=UPI002E136587|nr:SRPBCC family protein [Streptomyces sp. NBC_01197]